MKRKWLLLAIPLALALALIPLSRKQRDYLHLFERVPTTEGCAVIDDGMWISPDEIVCATARGSSLTSVLGGGNPLLMPNKPTNFEAVAVATGARRQLAATPPHYEMSGTWGAMTSPDGKWIVWPSQKYGPQTGSNFNMALWSAMTLDGKQFVQRPRVADSNSGRGLAWLPDSSGWVEATVINRARNGWQNGVTLRVCWLQSNNVRKIDVPAAKNAGKTFAVTHAGEAVIGCDGGNLKLVFVPLNGSGAVRVQTVALPAQLNGGKTIARSLISPRGDRIAWAFHDVTNSTVELWLSDIGGKKFEPIAPDLPQPLDEVRHLNWTPDGKALSFWRIEPGINRIGAYSFYRVNIPGSLSLKP